MREIFRSSLDTTDRDDLVAAFDEDGLTVDDHPGQKLDLCFGHGLTCLIGALADLLTTDGSIWLNGKRPEIKARALGGRSPSKSWEDAKKTIRKCKTRRAVRLAGGANQERARFGVIWLNLSSAISRYPRVLQAYTRHR